MGGVMSFCENEARKIFEHYLQPLGRTNNKGEILTHCCFHDDSRPSLSINLKRGIYYCFGCGNGGGLFDFVSINENFNVKNDRFKISKRIKEIQYGK